MSNNLQLKKILSYDDVAQFAAGTSNERMVDVRTYDTTIVSKYSKFDMLPYTGDKIFVRDSVAKRITAINQRLIPRGYTLQIVYGYRHPAIQEKYFQDCLEAMSPTVKFTGERLNAYIHNFVAVPDVAGHPCGGAVDLTILDKDGTPLDMGTALADYTDPKKIQTFSDNLTPEQTTNRMLLHDLMVEQGFAPFYGEWWHFSYGDREWAAFYNQKTALYGAVDFTCS